MFSVKDAEDQKTYPGILRVCYHLKEKKET